MADGGRAAAPSTVEQDDMITAALLQHWGGVQLRPAQKEAIDALLAGKDAFICLRTGYGKSLCFQAPAAARRGVTVVITPLLALAQDQLTDLVDRGVSAAKHTSDTEPEMRIRLIADLAEDEPETRLLYLTPEGLLRRPEVFEALRSLHERRLLNAIAVDEAHCVSEWGHEFRKDYREIAAVRERLGKPSVPIQALTATATAHVREDVIKGLKLVSPVVITGSNDRPNIRFEVVDGESIGDVAAEEAALVQFVSKCEGSGIVYCRTRKEVDRVSDLLCDGDIDADAYHAGKDEGKRRRLQNDWSVGGTRVVVATVAFGMGVNKADVRFVVHWDPPATLENLLQEAGRAGRDGLPAISRVFFTPRRLPPLDSPLHPKMCVRRVCTASISDCRRALLLAHFDAATKGKIATAASVAAAAAPAEDGPKGSDCCDLCEKRPHGAAMPVASAGPRRIVPTLVSGRPMGSGRQFEAAASAAGGSGSGGGGGGYRPGWAMRKRPLAEADDAEAPSRNVNGSRGYGLGLLNGDGMLSNKAKHCAAPGSPIGRSSSHVGRSPLADLSPTGEAAPRASRTVAASQSGRTLSWTRSGGEAARCGGSLTRKILGLASGDEHLRSLIPYKRPAGGRTDLAELGVGRAVEKEDAVPLAEPPPPPSELPPPRQGSIPSWTSRVKRKGPKLTAASTSTVDAAEEADADKVEAREAAMEEEEEAEVDADVDVESNGPHGAQTRCQSQPVLSLPPTRNPPFKRPARVA